jgi:ATP-dependent exoDNAse (exonuclease V) beta subunit
VDLTDADAIAAAAIYRRLRQRGGLDRLLESGDVHFEVPFSFHPPDRAADLVRGVIDCLIVDDDGAATVVEFKTGAHRPEHDAQAEVYARAIEAAFGRAPAAVKILYP